MKQWLIEFWARAKARRQRLAIIMVGIVTLPMVAGAVLWVAIQRDITTVNANHPAEAYSSSSPVPALTPSSTEIGATSSSAETTTASPSSRSAESPESPAVTTTPLTTTPAVAATTARPAPPRAPDTAYCRLDSGGGKLHYTKQNSSANNPDWVETDNDQTYLVWADSDVETWQRVPLSNPDASPEMQDGQAPGGWTPASNSSAEQASHASFVRLWRAGLANSPLCPS